VAVEWLVMDEMRTHMRSERGFGLLEAFIAMIIMTVGLMALAQVLYAGIAVASTSTPNLVAREKAREAVESVHTARDTFIIQWAQIRNTVAPIGCPAGTTGNGGGVFLESDDTEAMQAPGPDGLVNTADDTGVETLPGPDGEFGTADDVPLTGYTRQVMICDVDGNPDLRQIVVTVGYEGSNAFGERRRQYRLVTLVSRFS
jgi:type II secretory pathway pseudopilin PulG